MAAGTDLVALAHRSFIGSFRKTVEHIPGGGSIDLPGVFAFCSDLPISSLNGLVVTGQEAALVLDEALDWIAGCGRPYTVWVAEPLVDALSVRLAASEPVRRQWTTPGMVLVPTSPPPTPRPGVTVVQVTDATYEEHLATWAEDGLPEAVARRLMSPDFLNDPEVVMHTGYLDGRPAGVAVAIRTGTTSEIVGVGTLPAARRRGVGTALTWAAVKAGRGWGAEAVVLQSTEMGYPVYQAMGFKTVVGYVEFGAQIERA